MPASFIEKLRSARKIEWIALAVALALLGLILLDAGERESASDELERRLERALSNIEHAGKTEVMITQTQDGAIGGVLIISEGGDDIGVRLRMEQAVRALLDVDLNRIEVVKMSR